MYGLQLFDSWLYDETKPFIHMQAIPTFEFLKEQVETGYFEELIQKYLLDNTHGSIVIIKPERGRTARMDKELADKLQAYKDSLSKEEIDALVRATKELEEYQEEESAPEDLAKIPVLGREDISREIAPIYNKELETSGVKLVHHEVETNGIGYTALLFDLSGIPEEKLPYISILQSVLGIINTKNYEYSELFNEINVHTGGIGTSLELYTDVTKAKEKAFRATFEVKTKALYDKIPFALQMMMEILTTSKLEDEKRLKEIIAMNVSRLQMKFLSSGHVVAAMRAMSYCSPISKFKELTSGVEYYRFLSKLNDNFENEKETLIENLQKLVKMIFSKGNMMVSYTATKEGLAGLEAELAKVRDGLYEAQQEEHRCVIHCEKKNEGFQTSSKVQFVAQAGNFLDAGKEYHGALQILKVIMSYEYLWINIRVKGGAYGCMSNFNRIGEGYFVSYRDPNLKKTLDVYAGVPEYLKNFTVSERDMTKYIIGTISNIDQPMTPAAKGDRSMNLYMNHLTEEMIQEERMQILRATQEDIRNLAEIAEAVLACNQICVIGNEEKIDEEKEVFGEVTALF